MAEVVRLWTREALAHARRGVQIPRARVSALAVALTAGGATARAGVRRALTLPESVEHFARHARSYATVIE